MTLPLLRTFREECPKHHGHKMDLEMTLCICGAIRKRAQMITMWAGTLDVRKASYPWKLGVMSIRPLTIVVYLANVMEWYVHGSDCKFLKIRRASIASLPSWHTWCRLWYYHSRWRPDIPSPLLQTLLVFFNHLGGFSTLARSQAPHTADFLAHMWVTKPPTYVFGTLPLVGGLSSLSLEHTNTKVSGLAFFNA